MTLTDIISKITLFAKRAIITANNSTEAVKIIQTGNGNALLVADSSDPDSTPFVIDSNGHVGIGVNPPAQVFNTPIKLHVGGNVRVDGLIETQRATGGGDLITLGNDAKFVDTGVTNTVSLQGLTNSNIGALQLGATGPTLYGSQTGRIGIGTTNPLGTLHVHGTFHLQALPTYANNAAAIAGGLVLNDVYKTATGELRIVI